MTLMFTFCLQSNSSPRTTVSASKTVFEIKSVFTDSIIVYIQHQQRISAEILPCFGTFHISVASERRIWTMWSFSLEESYFQRLINIITVHDLSVMNANSVTEMSKLQLIFVHKIYMKTIVNMHKVTFTSEYVQK